MNFKNKFEFEQAYESGLSFADIANICAVSLSTIRKWQRKHGIKARSVAEGTRLKWKDQEHRTKAIDGIRKGLLESIEKRRLASRLMWADPDFRQRQLIKMRSEEYRTLQSQLQIARLATNPEALSISITTLANNRNDPQIRALIRQSLQRKWRNQEFKIGMLKKLTDGRSTDEFKAKFKAIMKMAMNNDEIRLSLSSSSLMRWQDEDYHNRMCEISRIRWQNTDYRLKQAAQQHKRTKTSILESIVVSLLKSRNIEATPISLGPWTFDVYFEIENRKILIECQGDYWHRLPKTIIRDKQKNTYYNRYLADLYELHYIYEYEFYGVNKLSTIIDTILNNTTAKTEFSLNDVTVTQSSDITAINEFLWSYHYLGKTRSGIAIAATLHNQLIAIAFYAHCTRQQTTLKLKKNYNEVLELVRFCIKPGYNRKNFASWFLSRTTKMLPSSITTLVSFADEGAGHSGSIYKAAGWAFNGVSKNSYWYIDAEGHRYHKKSVWDQAKRFKMTESAYSTEMGLVKIIGKPLKRFILELT